MGYFTKMGSEWMPSGGPSTDIHAKLPPGNYVVKAIPMVGTLYLEEAPLFKPPGKVYGSLVSKVNRIMATFQDRGRSTGVLLTGEKGGGKTLMARLISLEAYKAKMPTIMVNIPLGCDRLAALLQAIEQPAAVLFDEFEKTYGDANGGWNRGEEERDVPSQQQILTILDGVFPTGKLFVFTCNDKWALDRHLHNRPGRIFYSIEFGGMEPGAVLEYCKDRLKDQKQVDEACRLAAMFVRFNFDMLQALVEEMNRFGEGALEAMEMLNIKPEYDAKQSHRAELVYKGKVIRPNDSEPVYIDKSPLLMPYIQGYVDPGEGGTRAFTLKASDLVKADHVKGIFVYKQGDLVATFTRHAEPTFNHREAMEQGLLA